MVPRLLRTRTLPQGSAPSQTQCMQAIPRKTHHRLLVPLETAWGVLAGTATAVGVVAAGLTYGLFISAALSISIAILVGTALWTVKGEVAMSSGFVVRASAWTSWAVFVVIGLCAAFHWFGVVAVAVLTVTAPVTVEGVARLSRWVARRRRPARSVGVTSDPVLLERRFRELVADIEPDDLQDH